MGLFDMRCGWSGLSTLRPGERFDCSMLLLCEREAALVPLLLPLTGAYDRYGRLELWDEHRASGHAEWLGRELAARAADAVARAGLSTSTGAQLAETFFAHAANTVVQGDELTIGGQRAVPCLLRGDVLRAIAESPESAPSEEEQALLDHVSEDDGWAAHVAWLERQGLTMQAAYFRAHPQLAGSLPAGTREECERMRRLLRYVEPRGGLRPMRAADGHQHDDGEMNAFAQAAWDSGDPVCRRLIGRWLAEDDVERELLLPLHETAAERAAAAKRVDESTVAAVLRALGLPEAEIATLVSAVESSPSRDRVLAMLQAPRSESPAIVAERDGSLVADGDRVAVDSFDYGYSLLLGRTLRVAPGTHVSAGEALTSGEVDLHDITRILGAHAAAEQIADILEPSLGLDHQQCRQLIDPMFSQGVLRETRQRIRLARDEDALFEAGLYPDPLWTSYATLLQHVDPSIDEVFAERTRRAAGLQRWFEAGEERFQLKLRVDPEDLARALRSARDRAA